MNSVLRVLLVAVGVWSAVPEYTCAIMLMVSTPGPRLLPGAKRHMTFALIWTAIAALGVVGWSR